MEYETDLITGAAKIPLHSNKHPGLTALVDIEDVPLVAPYRWNPRLDHQTFYAQSTPIVAGRKQLVQMHRLILGLTDPKVLVDHENHDGLDNRRENIRIASPSQNVMNARARRGGSSSYKGVVWIPKTCRWRAMAGTNDNRVYLGEFETEVQAAIAYDNAARDLFGDFAVLNFPEATS